MKCSTLRVAVLALTHRDLKVAYYRRSELARPIIFFIIVTALFPLAVGPTAQQLNNIGPGIIWVASLLATLLSLDALFRSDFEDGSLEQMALSPHPMTVLVMTKIIVYWIVTGLPLLIVAPLLALFMQMEPHTLRTLLLTLLLGTPILSLVGAVGAALTVGLQRGGSLLALLILPLYLPALIFGASAIYATASGLPATGQLYALGALLTIAIMLAPIAVVSALRVSIN